MSTSTEQESISTWLWPYMIDLYGNKWIRDHGHDDERNTWGLALRRFHLKQVQAAIADCLRIYPDWPPTLGQFRDMCKMHPNPDAPLQLTCPPIEEPDNLAWLADLKSMLMEAKAAEPPTDAVIEHHLKVLGMDEESMRKKENPWIEPGSRGACAYPGCCRPGSITKKGGNHYYCRDHYTT